MLLARSMTSAIAGVVLVGSASVFADTVALDATVSPTKSNGDFISGTGISAAGFKIVTDTDGTGDSVALKARNYKTDVYGLSGDHYFVNPGKAPFPEDRWNLSFDFQFTPGGTVLSDYSAYEFAISFDKDPGAGVDYHTAKMTLANWTLLTDSYIANPGGGAWSSDTVPFVLINSWQPQFFFAPFEGLPGDYNIKFEAFNGSTSVASTEIVVTVVPTPTAALGGAALMGLGGGFAVLRRRKLA